ncbi:hypothetical protein LOR_12c01330 [Legionella oakridgensis RV-2-2007]|nr:hypothetical protein LOR_12c01330 [Legionella oakridgensis RV-2-2007]
MLAFLPRLSLLASFLLSVHTLYGADTLLQTNHVREENKNMLGIFVGGTNAHHDNFFTYGFEYHRVIALPFGFSLIGEDVPNNIEGHHEAELVGLMTFNILKNISLGLGPGLQFEKGKSAKLLGRISSSYIFLLGNDIELIPSVDYNVVHDEPHNFIYGITLGKQF